MKSYTTDRKTHPNATATRPTANRRDDSDRPAAPATGRDPRSAHADDWYTIWAAKTILQTPRHAQLIAESLLKDEPPAPTTETV